MSMFHKKSRNSFQRPRKAKDLRVPKEDLHIHRGVVYRFNSDSKQKKRLLILTKEELLVTLEGHDFIITKIPLVTNYFMRCSWSTITCYVSMQFRMFPSWKPRSCLEKQVVHFHFTKLIFCEEEKEEAEEAKEAMEEGKED